MVHIVESDVLEASIGRVVRVQEWHDSSLSGSASLLSSVEVDQLEVLISGVTLHGTASLEERKLVPLFLSIEVLIFGSHVDDHTCGIEAVIARATLRAVFIVSKLTIDLTVNDFSTTSVGTVDSNTISGVN